MFFMYFVLDNSYKVPNWRGSVMITLQFSSRAIQYFVENIFNEKNQIKKLLF